MHRFQLTNGIMIPIGSWPIGSWYQNLASWMGGIKTKSTGSPAYFLLQATFGFLRSPIFIFTPLHLGAWSEASCKGPYLAPVNLRLYNWWWANKSLFRIGQVESEKSKLTTIFHHLFSWPESEKVYYNRMLTFVFKRKGFRKDKERIILDFMQPTFTGCPFVQSHFEFFTLLL